MHGAEEDQSTYAQKKAFKFKFRKALDDATTYERRNTRMIEKQKERFDSNNTKELISNFTKDPKEYENEYLDMVQAEAKNLYVDYFATDDAEGLDFLAEAELASFSEVFQNYQLAKLDRSSLQTFKAPETDINNGWFSNLNILMDEARSVRLKADKLHNDNTVNTLLSQEELRQIEEQRALNKKK